MTVREMVDSAKRDGIYHVNGLLIPVHIVDIRQVFSRVDYQITPVNGSGMTWTSSDKVSF